MPLNDQQPGLPRQIEQKQPPLGGFFMAYPWAAFLWAAFRQCARFELIDHLKDSSATGRDLANQCSVERPSMSKSASAAGADDAGF